MKVRVGFGLGNARRGRRRRASPRWSTALEQHGFDSLWLLGARQRRRRPTRGRRSRSRPGAPRSSSSARACRCCPAATRCCSPRSGRASTCSPAAARSPAFGLGVVDPIEQQAFGVAREERAPLLRRGAAAPPPALDRGRRRPRRPALPLRGHVDRHAAGPAAARRVARRPGAGGAAPGRAARRRLARELLHPGDCEAEGRVHRREAAADASAARSTTSTSARWSSTRAPRSPSAYARSGSRRLRGVDPGEVITVGLDALRDASRSSSRSASRSSCWCRSQPVESWDEELDELADAVLDLQ